MSREEKVLILMCRVSKMHVWMGARKILEQERLKLEYKLKEFIG